MLPHAVVSICRLSLLGLAAGAIALGGGEPRLIASPAAAGAPLAMRVYPEVSFEPSSIRVQVIIERSEENRALEITAESGDFLRSSAIQLDGEDSPRVNMFEFRELPAGAYEVRGALFGRNGRRRGSATRQIIVIGRSVGLR
jgi:hypothetical protein